MARKKNNKMMTFSHICSKIIYSFLISIPVYNLSYSRCLMQDLRCEMWVSSMLDINSFLPFVHVYMWQLAVFSSLLLSGFYLVDNVKCSQFCLSIVFGRPGCWALVLSFEFWVTIFRLIIELFTVCKKLLALSSKSKNKIKCSLQQQSLEMKRMKQK